MLLGDWLDGPYMVGAVIALGTIRHFCVKPVWLSSAVWRIARCGILWKSVERATIASVEFCGKVWNPLWKSVESAAIGVIWFDKP